MKRPDSLIFDMDGTLWDAVDVYVECWNKAFESKGIELVLARDSMTGFMGKDPNAILNGILPGESDSYYNELFKEVVKQYHSGVHNSKAVIYPYVKEGLELLSKKYTLFMLSNCEKDGIKRFLDFSQTSHLFKDYMEFGSNNMPKNFNMKLLKDKYNLESPVYVGDTSLDSSESKLASIPFIFMNYGFGDTDSYEMKFETFELFTDYFMSL